MITKFNERAYAKTLRHSAFAIRAQAAKLADMADAADDAGFPETARTLRRAIGQMRDSAEALGNLVV